MQGSSKTLEITVISGDNLCVDQNPVTKNAYVVVRTESINSCTTKMATEEGSHASWNEKLWLDMPMHARSITFEVQCKTSKGVRSVGVARIAVSDFLGGSVPESCLQVLSYRLRNWEGRRSGVITFSVRVKTPEDSCSEMKLPAKGTDTRPGELESEVVGVQQVGNMNPNGVVTGIPVWWNYPSACERRKAVTK